jgi:DNA-binding MarR family transcriptional regulator
METAAEGRPDMEEELGALVMQTAHRIMRMTHQEHARRGVLLTMQQGGVMMFISRHPGCSLSDLANKVGATNSATSKLVDGLVDRGFVRREIDPEDRRRITLSLTEAGQADKDSVDRMAEEFAAEKLNLLSPREREIVGEAMKLLSSAFVQQNVNSTTEVQR